MTTAELLAAYAAYAAAYAQWESGFDLAGFMERPAAPVESPAALAGEIIRRRGTLTGAMAEALTTLLDDDTSDRLRAAYKELVWAAVE